MDSCGKIYYLYALALHIFATQWWRAPRRTNWRAVACCDPALSVLVVLLFTSFKKLFFFWKKEEAKTKPKMIEIECRWSKIWRLFVLLVADHSINSNTEFKVHAKYWNNICLNHEHKLYSKRSKLVYQRNPRGYPVVSEVNTKSYIRTVDM